MPRTARSRAGCTLDIPDHGRVSSYVVTLQARPGRTTATGHWAELAPAERKYREWVGAHGIGEAVIELAAEDDDGSRRVLRRWPPAADGQEGVGS